MQSSNKLSRVGICALSVMQTGSCCVDEKFSCGADFASRCYNDQSLFFVVACLYDHIPATMKSVLLDGLFLLQLRNLVPYGTEAAGDGTVCEKSRTKTKRRIDYAAKCKKCGG